MRASEAARQAAPITGIGEIGASALLASVGDFRQFRSGALFSARIGLVPRQNSSGGKTRLGRITKAGDAYLRTLLNLSARAGLPAASAKHDQLSRWATALAKRRGYWKTVVTIAAKNARMALAMLAKSEDFKPVTV